MSQATMQEAVVEFCEQPENAGKAIPRGVISKHLKTLKEFQHLGRNTFNTYYSQTMKSLVTSGYLTPDHKPSLGAFYTYSSLGSSVPTTATNPPTTQAPVNHPGEIIRGIFETRMLSPQMVAKRYGLAPSTLGRFLKGKARCSPAMSVGLGKLLGFKPCHIAVMQAKYDVAIEERK